MNFNRVRAWSSLTSSVFWATQVSCASSGAPKISSSFSRAALKSYEAAQLSLQSQEVAFKNSQERLVYRESHDFNEGWNKTQLHYKGYSVFVDKNPMLESKLQIDKRKSVDIEFSNVHSAHFEKNNEVKLFNLLMN